MDNIAALNKLIYARAKLVSDKIGIPQRNSNRNRESRWEMRIERQIKKPRQQGKILRNIICTRTQRNEKIPKRQPQTNLTIQLEEINQKILMKEEKLKRY